MGFEVDFLPVGDEERSGDAVVVRFGDLFSAAPNQTVVVIDGGFVETGPKIVEHIIRYYRTNQVDLLVSTHPDSDHVGGLAEVVSRLNVRAVAMHLPWNHTQASSGMFRDGRVTDMSVRESLRRSLDQAFDLYRLVQSKGIPIFEPFQGASFFNGQLNIIGPSLAYYESLIPLFRGTPEPKFGGLLEQILGPAREVAGRVFETWGIETLSDMGQNSAENESSVICLFGLDGQQLLLTADAGISALTQAVTHAELLGFSPSLLKVVQIPHHGSKQNVGPAILNRMLGGPRLTEITERHGFVSAAKKADSKHPSKRVTNAFKRRGTAVCQTHGDSLSIGNAAPPRPGWTSASVVPFHSMFDED